LTVDAVTLMTAEHKANLLNNMRSLVDNINIDYITTDLLQMRLLNGQEVETIRSKIGSDQAEHFLTDILPKKPDSAYFKLINILTETGQAHVVYILEPLLVMNSTAGIE